MKKLLIKLFGKESYCRLVHCILSDKNDNIKWYCEKCNISYKKRLSDRATGPP